MIGFISKLFGGSKSEKDVKGIMPLVAKINQHFTEYQSLSNDELRGKTAQFRQRIQQHLSDIDGAIAEAQQRGDGLSFDEVLLISLVPGVASVLATWFVTRAARAAGPASA